jgi:hypothetical protein
MPITFNNGVANIVGTPGVISGVFADQPNAADVADGTLYFSTDTIAIYQAVAGSWVNYSGGGGGSTGINGLNGTTNIGLGGTLLNDTFIACANFDLSIYNLKILSLLSSNGTGFFLVDNQIYTINPSGLTYGLFIDFATNLTILGDINLNTTIFQIDSGNNIIESRFNTLPVGIQLNFVNKIYSFGDYNYTTNNGGSFIINDFQNTILTKWVGQEAGLKIDFNTQEYYLGDHTYTAGNGLFIQLSDGSRFIKTFDGNVNKGLKLHFANNLYQFGDFIGSNNNTYIEIDDANQKIKLKNTAGSYNFSNIPAYTGNAAALAAGLIVGDIYRHNGLGESQDQLRIVH